MPNVTFNPGNISVEVEPGTTILDAARKAGVAIESPCNKAGTCGKCSVQLDTASLAHITHMGGHALSSDAAARGYVLSCQTAVLGDITVRIPAAQKNRTLKILSDGESFDFGVDPAVTKIHVKEKNTTNVLVMGVHAGEEHGDTASSRFGVVVDIGTTTLVTSLVELASGQELSSVSALNPQATLAQDVLSRIKYASDAPGLDTMHSMFIGELNRMIGEITRSADVSPLNIYETVFSGNTCMLHLAVRINPASLGKYPFVPECSGGVSVPAKDLGIGISPFGLVYLPPVISAYVGADITSGILASQLYDEKEPVLFIDIGTNGEMALSSEGKIHATSTAAGPAFEGMNIEFGMRAAQGAIESFDIDDEGNANHATIGNAEAIGICGSGLLDIVGELAAHGIIDRQGKFVSPESAALPESIKARLQRRDGKLCFHITDTVLISQKDIRQVQLAKGAIRSGIECLIQDSGVATEGIGKVLIAGSFGYHLKTKSLFNLGLLPRQFDGKVRMVGNTSKSGGHAFLTNRSLREKMSGIVKDVAVIELANRKDFDRIFIEQLGF